MQYSREVEEMYCVAKGAKHDPAPIPEEGKWVKAKEIKDISGFTHGVGWCAPQQGAIPPQGVYAAAPAYDPYDHTAEFDPKDISDNKVFAMLCYLMGIFGIIIALLASNSSKYAMFHVRQALKFEVVNILMLICTLVLFWTIIVPVAYGIMSAVLWVIKIICFFQICSGKAKEPAIIRSLKFLR